MDHLWERPFQRVVGSRFPVFRQELPDYTIFYAPGCLVAVRPSHADELARQLALPAPEHPAAATLLRDAQTAQQQWEHIHSAEYSPICLTLYTSQKCNLQCTYCFSQDKASSMETNLKLDTILQAAELVALNCKTAKLPLTVLLHGGGEPTLDKRLPDILNGVEKIAKHYDIPIFRYLATNGVMSTAQANWVANRFDLIGLSCDGPPDVQAIQRPLKNGQSSTPAVERTAKIIREHGKSLHVRATITPETIERMPEIAAYLCEELQAEEIRIEPVFQGGCSTPKNLVHLDQAEQFCITFLEARRVAAVHQTRWMMTGSRLGEIHGRYCQVFRNVLHLIPGGGVSACFKVGGTKETEEHGLLLGENGQTNPARVAALKETLTIDWPECHDCFNQFHCARGCPDYCPVVGAQPSLHTVRCRINRLLSTALLQEIANLLRPALAHQPIAITTFHGTLL